MVAGEARAVLEGSDPFAGHVGVERDAPERRAGVELEPAHQAAALEHGVRERRALPEGGVAAEGDERVRQDDLPERGVSLERLRRECGHGVAVRDAFGEVQLDGGRVGLVVADRERGSARGDVLQDDRAAGERPGRRSIPPANTKSTGTRAAGCSTAATGSSGRPGCAERPISRSSQRAALRITPTGTTSSPK